MNMLNKNQLHGRRSVRESGWLEQLVPAVLTGPLMAALLVLAPTEASAQSLGAPRDLTTRTEILEYLGQTYDEAPVAGGIASNGSVLEVFTSPDGNSWTIVLTSPDGTSQVMAAGETWLELLKLKGERI
jgi:hypothetical protein